MNKIFTINRQIKPFNKKITIEGDKSISIRWALLASQANGKSIAYNLLKSEDVLKTINYLKVIVSYMEMALMDIIIKKN